jgi:glucosylglycerate synthase
MVVGEMPETGVQQDAQRQVETSEAGGIVIGILSYNNIETIGNVIHVAQEGLSMHFPGSRNLLVHADGGSKDGTQALAEESVIDKKDFLQIAYPIYPLQRLSPEHFGVPGKANAIKAICSVASERNAEVCMVVDSNVRSVKQEWIRELVHPIIEGFDLTTPCYLRHKFDGAMLSGIVYPFTRALYGKRILQPMGGEFAFSLKMVKYFLQQPQRDGETADSGSDLSITIQAVRGGFRLAQAFLGSRTLGDREPAPEVSSILAQTLGSIFTEMDQTASIWQRVRGSEKVSSFGPCGDLDTAPAPVDINPMIQSFRLGYQSLQDIWRMVLPPATLMELKRMSSQTEETFRFDDSLWARVIYDFALAWRIRIIDRDHLLKALTPLYLGWVASYIRAVRDADSKQTQALIERLSLAFEIQKSYFISRWRWPDRFNP